MKKDSIRQLKNLILTYLYKTVALHPPSIVIPGVTTLVRDLTTNTIKVKSKPTPKQPPMPVKIFFVFFVGRLVP